MSFSSKKIFATLFLTLSICYFFLVSNRGFWFLSFGDEAEHLLGAKIINDGGRLYVDYVDTHGPVIFLLGQIYGFIFGWHFPQGARAFLPIMGLFLPILTFLSLKRITYEMKCTAISTYLLIISFWWLYEGLYLVSFYPISGFLISILLSIFIFPSLREEDLPSSTLIASGSLCVIINFTAYSNGPSTFLFALSGLWPLIKNRDFHRIKLFILGVIISLMSIIIWILKYSDLKGFVLYHILFNQVSYSKFVDLYFFHFLSTWCFNTDKNFNSVNFSHIYILTSMFFCFFYHRNRNYISLISLFAGIVLLNYRAAIGFKDGETLIVSIMTLVLSLVLFPTKFSKKNTNLIRLIIISFVLIFSSKIVTNKSISSPFGWDKHKIYSQPHYTVYTQWSDLTSQRIRELTPHNEVILSLPYFPEMYWFTGRMPMNGIYEYLPWDAEWAKQNKFPTQRNLCIILEFHKPKIIYYTIGSEKVFSSENYYECVLQKIREYYTTDPINPSIHILRPIYKSEIYNIKGN